MDKGGQDKLGKLAKGLTLFVFLLLIYKFVIKGDATGNGMWAIFALSIFANLLSYRRYKRK